MASKFHYYIDPEADRKLFKHLEFLARVSEAASLRLYYEYKDAINFIEENASGCQKYYSNKLPDIDLRYWIFGKQRYRIVFEIIDNDVFAYDIQDCRQNPDNNIV